METTELVRKALMLGAVQVPAEITQLVELLKKHQVRNVLEIGSEAGGTFYLWCRLTAIGGLKISLDLPSGDSGSGKYRTPQALAARTKEFKCWAANVHVVTGDSHELNTWQAVDNLLSSAANNGRVSLRHKLSRHKGELSTRGVEKLDFLFIDGDHSYEGAKADYEDYKGFVRPGGLIAFHDIVDSDYHRTRGCFVAQLWNEIQGTKQEFIAGECWGGIGVVSV